MEYKIKHIGINTPDDAHAQPLCEELTRVFGLERNNESDASAFIGTIFEVMKHENIGTMGHIALQTDDVEAAMADLASKGITFKPETIRRDENGKATFAYLEQQFGGFAVHLTI